jgi:hypothetical protein
MFGMAIVAFQIDERGVLLRPTSSWARAHAAWPEKGSLLLD